MSERIDHAKEAREWIDAVSNHPEETPGAILAQAEATLALAEQQLIANLIALGILGVDEVPETGERGLVYTPPDDARECPDVARALGIGDDDE